jgi:hypothetical protein
VTRSPLVERGPADRRVPNIRGSPLLLFRAVRVPTGAVVSAAAAHQVGVGSTSAVWRHLSSLGDAGWSRQLRQACTALRVDRHRLAERPARGQVWSRSTRQGAQLTHVYDPNSGSRPVDVGPHERGNCRTRFSPVLYLR